MKSLNKRILIAILAGFLLGVFWLVAVRFITYKSNNVHYHANFALYINGKRDEFKNFTFYEEVNSCASDDKSNPKDRVHMHDNNNGLVHVHAPGVAWGHFFANLGYTLGNTVVKTDSGTYIDGVDGNKLTFILNGKQVDTIANRLISSEDRLLINFGNDDQKTLDARYQTVPTDAGKANTQHDPASCSGGVEVTPKTRLIHALGLQGN